VHILQPEEPAPGVLAGPVQAGLVEVAQGARSLGGGQIRPDGPDPLLAGDPGPLGHGSLCIDPEFDDWLLQLKDLKGRAWIAARINSAAPGQRGNHRRISGLGSALQAQIRHDSRNHTDELALGAQHPVDFRQGRGTCLRLIFDFIFISCSHKSIAVLAFLWIL